MVSRLLSRNSQISFREAAAPELSNFSSEERCPVCQEEITSSSSDNLSARAIIVHDGQHPIHRECFAQAVEQALRARSSLTNRRVVCLTCTRQVDLTSLSRVFPEISVLSDRVSILQRKIENFAMQREAEPEYSRTSSGTRTILFAIGVMLIGAGISYCINDLKGRTSVWIGAGIGAVFAIFIPVFSLFLTSKRAQAVFLLFTAPLIAHMIGSFERTQAGFRRYVPLEGRMKLFCGSIVAFALFMLVLKLGSQNQRFIPYSE